MGQKKKSTHHKITKRFRDRNNKKDNRGVIEKILILLSRIKGRKITKTTTVLEARHRYWHMIFNDRGALEIAQQINQNNLFGYRDIIGAREASLLGETIVWRNREILSLKNDLLEMNEKQIHAWNRLFAHLEPLEIIKEINTIWLDPRFELYIKEREAGKT